MGLELHELISKQIPEILKKYEQEDVENEFTKLLVNVINDGYARADVDLIIKTIKLKEKIGNHTGGDEI